MQNRCKKCGVEIDIGDLCNHCLVVREEKNFLNMVTREELDRYMTTDVAHHSAGATTNS